MVDTSDKIRLCVAKDALDTLLSHTSMHFLTIEKKKKKKRKRKKILKKDKDKDT